MILPRPATKTARGPRVWDARRLQQDSATWQRELPVEVLEELQDWHAAREVAAEGGDEPLTPLERAAARRELPRLHHFATELRDELLNGTGVIWLKGPDPDRYGDALAKRTQELIGCALGEPIDLYGRQFEIRDRGVDHLTERVPVSMTNATTSFHTDSSRRDVLPDLVGMLCERPALEGGDSLVSNALRVHAELAAEAPAALAELEVARIRDLVTPGSEGDLSALRANSFPVFGGDPNGSDFAFRHMRLWIERGQERAGAPLDGEALEALDRLDELLADPRFAVRLRLARGDMLWVDNRRLAHDRDGYVDDPAAPRCLYRMWIDCGRPHPQSEDEDSAIACTGTEPAPVPAPGV